MLDERIGFREAARLTLRLTRGWILYGGLGFVLLCAIAAAVQGVMAPK